jgi:hypothetical protein
VSEDAGGIEPRTVASLELAVYWLYLSPVGREGEGGITCSNDFFLPSRSLEEGARGQHPVEGTPTSLRRVSVTVQYIRKGIIL